MTTKKIMLAEVGELSEEEQEKLITDNVAPVQEQNTMERQQLNG